MPTYTAVDLGATSGRVVNVRIDADGVALDLVRRFPNEIVLGAEGRAVWNFASLLAEIKVSLIDAVGRSQVRSVGVDSWAVDYGLLNVAGDLIGPVHAYRSRRTDGVMNAVVNRIGRNRLYATSGIQFLPFNTIYQLTSAAGTADYRHAATMLMIPDLINHALCGSTSNDVTNASTTQLLDARTHHWSDELIDAAGLRRDLFPELHEPGTRLGTIDAACIDPSVTGLVVVAVASHDTASAVAGTPLTPGRPAMYISCGTWGLVGCELTGPITTDAALRANVTNELGWNGTTRLLKNVTGLWLLEECNSVWVANGNDASIAELVALAAELPGGRAVFDPDDARLGKTADTPATIRAICAATGHADPTSPAEITRAILDSLALGFRRAVQRIEAVAGFRSEVIHLVGGGSLNHLLAQLIASSCDRTVLAGPAEATVIGNALVQAIADGEIADLAEGRRLVERSHAPIRFEPTPLYNWSEMEQRVQWSAEA